MRRRENPAFAVIPHLAFLFQQRGELRGDRLLARACLDVRVNSRRRARVELIPADSQYLSVPHRRIEPKGDEQPQVGSAPPMAAAISASHSSSVRAMIRPRLSASFFGRERI
jgi:hypothetical protein